MLVGGFMKKDTKNLTKKDIIEAFVTASEIIEKKKEKDSFASDFLKYPIVVSFRTLSVVLGILAISVIGTFVVMIKDNKITDWTNGISIFLLLISLFLLLVIFVIYCWKVSTEIKKEKDKNFIISYFSAIIVIVALIISIMAYLKS